MPPPPVVQEPSGWALLSPTAAMALGAEPASEQDGTTTALLFWVGAAMHLRRAPVSPFVALGSELNGVRAPAKLGGGEYFEAVPSLRLGLALLPSPLTWESQTFPSMELYGIVGWRVANGYRGDALRAGVGLSLPELARIQSRLFRGCSGAPVLPWMLEFVVDEAPARDSVYALRIGYHF